MHRWGYTATPKEDPQGAAVASIHQQESQLRSRRDQYSEALWEAREVHQQALEVAHALEQDIERLSWGMKDAPIHAPMAIVQVTLDRCTRSPTWHRPERRVNFWEPEVDSKSGRPHIESWEHSHGMHNERSSGVLHQPEGGMVCIPRRCQALEGEAITHLSCPSKT